MLPRHETPDEALYDDTLPRIDERAWLDAWMGLFGEFMGGHDSDTAATRFIARAIHATGR